MTPLKRIALIGNHLPRRCGIATFTSDLRCALLAVRPTLEVPVTAMNDDGRNYAYPEDVCNRVEDQNIESYRLAADHINAAKADVACLQHEYGIFGGEAGSHILELISRIKAPLVTTLHTVLSEPNKAQKAVMGEIIERSSRLIVMASKGQQLLQSVHGVTFNKIDVIPHGIPDLPFCEPDATKAQLGFSGKSIILTFGLLSPSKGIETVIEAMPAIVAACPNAVYVVLGASHPNLIKSSGEGYRNSLIARAESLGVAANVVFIDQFVDQSTLMNYIAMCDVYVTPYLNAAQMTSGTLAYSFGSGKAVVSTPYWHAQELLAGDRGVLVPFSDTTAFGAEISNLLTDHARRNALRHRAYSESRSMVWTQTGKRYLASFETARGRTRPISSVPAERIPPVLPDFKIPDLRTDHFLSLCDSTGILQHSVYTIGDRHHGYCVDDNARALLFAVSLMKTGEQNLHDNLTSGFAAFVQHAWNPDTRRFRNFMSYDRRWLEPQGSEDSHGRTLWALGECVRYDASPQRRHWAGRLFAEALPVVERFTSPRAWAFTLLGLDGYCASMRQDGGAAQFRLMLSKRLHALLSTDNGDPAPWFEAGLYYDNARLPQALIVTGRATGQSEQVEAGLTTLRWLMRRQTSASRVFRPIGSDSFRIPSHIPEPFDQQPVEAAATISACLAATRVNGSREWPLGAMTAFEWFLGRNDLNVSLVDLATGGCADGLHRDRRNENQGAESVLSYLLGLIEVRAYKRTLTTDDLTLFANRDGRARPPNFIIQSKSETGSAPINISKSPESPFTAGPSPGRGQAI